MFRIPGRYSFAFFLVAASLCWCMISLPLAQSATSSPSASRTSETQSIELQPRPKTNKAAGPGNADVNRDLGLKREAKESYGSLPLSFEANEGQSDATVKFLARGNGYGLFLTSSGPVLALSNTVDTQGKGLSRHPALDRIAAVSFKLMGSSGSPRITGIEPLPGNANYFTGNDPAKWQKNVPAYAQVRYSNVYPGIDAIYYGNQRQLEYDFVVAPGKDPNRIAMKFAGADAVEINARGELVLRTTAGDIKQAKPVAYQEIGGQRLEVSASYRANKGGVVGFNLGKYDKTQALIIDPVLVYSSFLGGTNGEDGRAIAVDSEGNAYITGRTLSSNFPVVGGVQATKSSLIDAFIVKVNSTGNSLVYSTYLGGGGEDTGYGIKVDAQGNAYVGGSTWSNNFPTTAGALQTSKGNLGDGFVVKLNAAGSALTYSTYVGGDDVDIINGLALGADGRVTVTGNTSSSRFSTNVFPTPRGGSPVFRTADSAAHWSASSAGLTANTVNTFAIQTSNSNIIYAGSDTGLFKSTDGGANWSFLANGVPAENTNTVVIDPSNSAVIYAATDSSVYKSINGGATFDLKAQIFPTSLAIDPGTPATLYAGTALGLFKTTNGGDTWTEVSYGFSAPQSPYVHQVVVDPITPSNVYVGTDSSGVFKTVSGNGWVQLNAGSFHTNDTITALALDPSNSSTIYAGVQNQPNLIKWTNGGASFTTINVTYMDNGESKFPDVSSLAIDPATPATMYVGSKAGYGVLKSVDGGATWNQSNTGLTRLFINSVTLDPSNPAILFVGAYVFSDCFVARLNSAGSALDYVRNFGGTSTENAAAVGVDTNGNAYVGGGTGSTDFPLLNAFQSTPTKFGDAFFAKFDNSGNFIYSTFLGGSFDESITAVTVSNGSPVIVGQTSSSDFPIVNGIKSTLTQQDAFVAKFNATGSALDFSTYLGGSSFDQALGVTLDAAGNIYVTGSTQSADFPLQSAAQPTFGGSSDAFVTEFDPSGNQIIASTYLGGSASDQANGIAVDGVGAAYVTGVTSSNNFPTLNAYQVTRQGNDAFFAKIGSASSLATNVQFSQPVYQVNENGLGGVQLTVNRTGHIAGETTVNYTTSDSATGNCSTVTGKASSKCDYEATFGTLHFTAGETSKVIYVPIVDDSYVEGNETFNVSLLGATGATIIPPATATVTIIDNDSANGPNPIDNANFFVRQHYIDFLNREPDAPGLAFWANQITECQQPGATCNAAVRRINVSAAFFLSIEFQETGYLVERLYKVSFGDATGTSNFGPTHTLSVPIVRLNEFLPDSQEIGRGLIVGNPGWEQVLENNKVAFINQFVLRSRFQTSYSALLTPAQFVDQLFAHAGVMPTAAERTDAINEFGGAADSANNAARARALRRVAENHTLNGNEKNRAFVLMQYFGYLRRNPNDPQDTDYSGYDFWLSKLNQFNGNFVNADMVQAFLDSGEYRARFGP